MYGAPSCLSYVRFLCKPHIESLWLRGRKKKLDWAKGGNVATRSRQPNAEARHMMVWVMLAKECTMSRCP